jgi:trk system potassium uptake protein TrkA
MAAYPSVAVIGLGTFGAAVAGDLTDYGHHVIGVDSDETRVNAVAETVTQSVIADARDEAALRDAGVDQCAVAVVAMGENLEASLLCAMNLKVFDVPNVWVKSRSRTHRRILSKIGVQRIVNPEMEMGRQVAQRIHNPFVGDYMSAGRGRTVVSFAAPEPLVGRRLAELRLPDKHSIECLGLLRGPKLLRMSDDPVLEADDTMLLLGRRQDLQRFGESHCR